MTQEERRAAGVYFDPADPQLMKEKQRAHALSRAYSALDDEETAKRAEILKELTGEIGENAFVQGPVFFHYGKHTRIGKNFFANYNLTVQDDGEVTIGDDCDFGPNVTIVTPVHPMLGSERRGLVMPDGRKTRVCRVKGVHIGNGCWLCAGVTVCSGVTIGDGCVIGAGSVVTRDIPPNSFAAGVPCRVIRKLGEKDSIQNFPELAAGIKTGENGKQ